MFNEEQQKAIETIKGQLILVACPGSGKTTTLLGRIHEMIQQGVPAENILMVTFTTAAAGEMKQRFWKKYAEDGMVTFCTIHSFCLATLKKFAHFDAECVLATGDIYEFFFQQLVRHNEIVDKVEYIKALLLDIAVCKNSMCPLAQFEPNCGEKELFDELFKAYENWKDALGKIDYDDMLLKAYESIKRVWSGCRKDINIFRLMSFRIQIIFSETFCIFWLEKMAILLLLAMMISQFMDFVVQSQKSCLNLPNIILMQYTCICPQIIVRIVRLLNVHQT